MAVAAVWSTAAIAAAMATRHAAASAAAATAVCCTVAACACCSAAGSAADGPPAAAAGPARPASEPSASASASTAAESAEAPFADDRGRELCLKFAGFQRGKCRHGDACRRSHDPPCAESLARLQKRKEVSDAAAAGVVAQRAAEARAAWDKPLPDWLHAARAELMFAADATPSLERMRSAAAAFLAPAAADGSTPSPAALDRLHTTDPSAHATPPICPSLYHAYILGGFKMPYFWKKVLLRQKKLVSRFQRDKNYNEWLEAYRDFVREVVVPLCGDLEGVVFQCPPTLRVHFPGKAPTIGMHCDSEYDKHESAEINFWVPLTDVFGSNTLHTESAPGRGDFRPMDMPLGQGLRFNGSLCRHYTLPNETGRTRVSFDFRIIPKSLYRNDWDGVIGDYKAEHAGGPGEAARQ